MASIEKIDAIALRILPYSNTSQIVLWLTSQGERLATLAKGAYRPKSAFAGQVDLFYTCELLYYRQHEHGLRIARECCALNARPRLRQDWRAYGCASYLCHLIMLCTLEGDHDPERYALAQTALNLLNDIGGRPELVYWFELQWLRHLGLAPRLQACTTCQRDLPVNGRTLRWGRHGVLCGQCPPPARADTGPSLPLSPDVLAILRRWQAQPHPHILTTTQCSPLQLLAFDRILGTFIDYHIENMPDSRRITIDLVSSCLGAQGRSR